MGDRKLDRRRIQGQMVIPAELMPGAPVIELNGFRTVSVDGHRGIRHYSEERIDVMTKDGLVAIEGETLHLQQMDREKIVVKGRVILIRLERNGI